MEEAQRYLVGIDDTDNLESRGTGARVRELGARLAEAGLAEVAAITRHQLFVSPEIPYTSHNSAACMALRAADLDALAGFCRDFLLRDCAPGSDAGLCIAAWPVAAPDLLAYGERAKREVIARAETEALAAQHGLLLEALTGDGGGVIGALAGVALRATGNDGRFLWLPGLRDLSGVFRASHLYQATDIDQIQTLGGAAPLLSARIEVSPWPQPVLLGGQAVLFVEEVPDHAEYDWRIVAKDIIKRY